MPIWAFLDEIRQQIACDHGRLSGKGTGDISRTQGAEVTAVRAIFRAGSGMQF
jgi:hypothetical protein